MCHIFKFSLAYAADWKLSDCKFILQKCVLFDKVGNSLSNLCQIKRKQFFANILINFFLVTQKYYFYVLQVMRETTSIPFWSWISFLKLCYLFLNLIFPKEQVLVILCTEINNILTVGLSYFAQVKVSTSLVPRNRTTCKNIKSCKFTILRFPSILCTNY